MSEAEKEFTELKEHIEVLCSKLNQDFSNTIGEMNSVESKNHLLEEQNKAINFLKEI